MLGALTHPLSPAPYFLQSRGKSRRFVEAFEKERINQTSSYRLILDILFEIRFITAKFTLSQVINMNKPAIISRNAQAYRLTHRSR